MSKPPWSIDWRADHGRPEDGRLEDGRPEDGRPEDGRLRLGLLLRSLRAVRAVVRDPVRGSVYTERGSPVYKYGDDCAP